MSGSTVVLSVLADTAKAKKGLDDISARMGKLGDGFSKAGNIVGLASAGIAAGIGKAVSAASDLQQNVGGVQAVFGKFAGSVIANSNAAAKAVGLSADQYDSFATVIGSQLKNAGTPMDQLGSKTNALIKQASDLSATFGGSTADAVDALSSAMKGEMDPIEKYGISLNQAMLQQQAASMGITTNSQAWTNAQKQQIILAAVTKQGAAAQGQFAKQTNTLAEQQQIAKAKFDNLNASLGSIFLPIVSKVVNALTDFMNGPGKQFIDWASKNPSLIIGLVAGIGGLAIALKTAGAVMKSWETITKIASAAQAAFNAVMDANPISLIIIGIAALVAGLTIFFTKTKLGRAIVQDAFGAISTAMHAVADWWTGTAAPAIGAAWSAVLGFFSAAKHDIGAAMGVIGSVIRAVWNFSPYGIVVNNWGKIIAWFRSVPSAVTGALGDLGSLLYNAGSSIITGLWRGLKAEWENVKSWVSGLGSWIADHKGPKSVDLKLLVPNGGWVMQGLVAGLRQSRPALAAELSSITGDIASTRIGAPSLSAYDGAPSLRAPASATPAPGASTSISQISASDRQFLRDLFAEFASGMTITDGVIALAGQNANRVDVRKGAH